MGTMVDLDEVIAFLEKENVAEEVFDALRLEIDNKLPCGCENSGFGCQGCHIC
jgi:hypothetical protein